VAFNHAHAFDQNPAPSAIDIEHTAGLATVASGDHLSGVVFPDSNPLWGRRLQSFAGHLNHLRSE
jgi:hypothetical protein